MTAREFDYDALDYEEIGRFYAEGWGWRGIAKHFNVPDHKTLEKYALRRLPNLEPRDRAEAQRARRQREATSRPSAKQRPSDWYGGGQ